MGETRRKLHFMPHLKTRFEEFYTALADEGLKRALEVLSRKVPHRFSAVYRLEGDVLYNLALVDKDGGVPPAFLESGLLNFSFSQFALRDGHFSTADSGSDQRLAGLPFQGVVVSYTGVPITASYDAGEVVGALCHFDVVSRDIAEFEFELLQRAAKLITGPMLRA